MNSKLKWVNYVNDEEGNPISLPGVKDIELMESKLGVLFPEDYKQTLLQHQGQAPDEMCVLDEYGNSYLVGAMLHVFGNKLKVSYCMEFSRHLLVEQDKIDFLVPIFHTFSASTFCFDYRDSATNPKVVYFFIDNHDPEDPDTIDDAVKIVGNSFTDFLNKMVYCRDIR